MSRTSPNRFVGVLILCLLCLVLLTPAVCQVRTFKTSDDRLSLKTDEEFESTFNPHALLSLQTPEKSVVIVTRKKKEFTITELYDGIPSTFTDGVVCQGRVLLAIDGEEAPAFLVEGMFPPEEPTHHTLFVVVNHEKFEYTLMIHYPEEMGDAGFEWATGLLQKFQWNDASSRNS